MAMWHNLYFINVWKNEERGINLLQVIELSGEEGPRTQDSCFSVNLFVVMSSDILILLR